MSLVAYFVAYLGIAVFSVAVLARIVMWSKLPLHLRWELYPIPHEAKRAHYGGSYLEEVDWWQKPREVSLWNELRAMIPEILFLVALKEHNPKLWRSSFPFHFGLYLLIGCSFLMMGSGVLNTWWPLAISGSLGTILHHVITACGICGLLLGLFGALGLLHRRLVAEELKDFTTSSDIFNLVFFVLVFGFALITIIFVDRDLSRAKLFVQNLIFFRLTDFQGSGLESTLPTLAAILLALLVGYIPLTHMSHFIGKYFAYHAIRWNDTPNLKGGEQEAVIQELLDRKVSWAAPHIQGDASKSWVEVAKEKAQP